MHVSQRPAEPTALVLATAVLVAALCGLLAWGGGGTTLGDSAPGIEPGKDEPVGASNAVLPAPPARAASADTRSQNATGKIADARSRPDAQVASREPPEPLVAGERVEDLCRRIGSKLGSVSAADCLRIDLRFDGGRSVLGSPLVAADFQPAGPALGRVLLLGGIHGDEYSSVSIVFRWLEALVDDGPGTLQWRILPLLNPDGLLRARSQRMNDRGVDLNRNFPTDNWDEDATDYWVRRTFRNPRRYPGPEPLSEPESRYLVAQIQDFEPDLIVAVHAPLEVVDFDGRTQPPQRLGSLYLHRMGTYPGSLGRYGSEQLGLPVVTIELSSAGIMPPPAEIRRIWRDLVDYARRTLAFEGDAPIAAEPTAGANLR